ncbi:hypothetical protein M0657_004579 [Pyricularia oryzae]|nr:hypothetical protein M9X92_006018 [Pyricularia oryzae]KAI7924535.1 hypothetical protein M0657_004579 [Pyricularia oryzae]
MVHAPLCLILAKLPKMACGFSKPGQYPSQGKCRLSRLNKSQKLNTNGNDKAVSYTADALAMLEIPGSRATLVKDVGAGPGEFSEGVLLNRSSIAFVGGNAAWGSRGPGDKV